WSLWGGIGGSGRPRLQSAERGKYSRHLFDDPRSRTTGDISLAKLARRCLGIAGTPRSQAACRSEWIANLLALAIGFSAPIASWHFSIRQGGQISSGLYHQHLFTQTQRGPHGPGTRRRTRHPPP